MIVWTILVIFIIFMIFAILGGIIELFEYFIKKSFADYSSWDCINYHHWIIYKLIKC